MKRPSSSFSAHLIRKFKPIFLLLVLLLTAVQQVSVAEADDSSSTSSIISRFQQYLQINTAQPYPQYQESTDFLLSEAKAIGLEAQTIEFVKGKPVVLLKWPGSDPTLPSILLNSHTDVVPVEHHKWDHPPFGAHLDSQGRIFARGSQDMKCVGIQYLEALRRLKASGFCPLRSIYLSFVPDEEIGGHDGAEKFAASDVFSTMNVGIVLDEGLASPTENYRMFYAERSPRWLVIKATGPPGHGAKLYDNSAMENLLKSIESVRRFRASQFDLVKSGSKAEGEVISVNMVFLKAGTPSPSGFVMNLQPSEAEAGFDIRIPPTADAESLDRRIAEEWAPASRNMTFQFNQKVSIYDKFGKPILTKTDSSNPWWALLEDAVRKAGGKLGSPEIFPASTDARYFRDLGIPAIGFSPMANTPILLHDHNEVCVDTILSSHPAAPMPLTLTGAHARTLKVRLSTWIPKELKTEASLESDTMRIDQQRHIALERTTPEAPPKPPWAKSDLQPFGRYIKYLGKIELIYNSPGTCVPSFSSNAPRVRENASLKNPYSQRKPPPSLLTIGAYFPALSLDQEDICVLEVSCPNFSQNARRIWEIAWFSLADAGKKPNGLRSGPTQALDGFRLNQRLDCFYLSIMTIIYLGGLYFK